LPVDAVGSVNFSLPAGAANGRYEADFRIVDAGGNYHDSITWSGTEYHSNFTIVLDAIPEPGVAAMAALGMLGSVFRRRR
jgi:hypothetical protein